MCYDASAGRGEEKMQSYSQDLRDRVLWALERGERPTAIARRLEASRVWVYQVRGREQKSGQRSSFQIGGHCHSRIAEQGISIKIGALWHQLNKWHLTFKKNPARHRARTRGRAAGAKSMAAGAAHDGSRKARLYR